MPREKRNPAGEPFGTAAGCRYVTPPDSSAASHATSVKAAAARDALTAKSGVTPVCCKWRAAGDVGGGIRYTWLTGQKDIRACWEGRYGERSFVARNKNPAGQSYDTREGCRDVMAGGEPLPGESVPDEGCCEFKIDGGLRRVWLTIPSDLLACHRGSYRGERSHVEEKVPRINCTKAAAYDKCPGAGYDPLFDCRKCLPTFYGQFCNMTRKT